MKHDEAAPLLPDHLEGRLEGPIGAEVEHHAAACDDCRALVESYRVLAEGFRAGDPAGSAGHPTVEELVDLALGRSDRSGAGRADEITRHLAACPPCAEDLDTVRRGQREAGRKRLRPAGRWTGQMHDAPSARLAAAIAAAIAIVILAYPAFLGMRELPRVREQAAELAGERSEALAQADQTKRALEESEAQRRRLAAWSGPIVVPLLAAPVRTGAAGPISIPVAQGQPFVCLVVDPGLLEPDPTPGVYLVEIIRPDRTTAWSVNLEPSEARRQLEQAGSLAFLIPSEELPADSYRLNITEHRGGVRRRLLDVPFAVVRPR